MRASILGLVTAAGVVAGASLAVVLTLGRSLATCYIDAVPMRGDHHLCGAGPWGPEWLPVAMLAVAVAVLTSAITATGAALVRQFRGAGQFARVLERRCVEPTPRIVRCAQAAGLPSVVYIDADEVVAVTVGAFRPRVFVTRGLADLLTDEELVAVLLHERAHVRGRHPAVFGLARSAAATSFALPAVQPLAQRVVLQSEVAADALAVGEQGVRPLASALGKLLGVVDPVDWTALGSVQGMLDQRIRALAGRDYGTSGSTRLLATLFAALTITAPALTVAASYAFVKGLL